MTGGTIESILTDLYEERGRLVPEEVVEVASAPDHPLHSQFEWDDTEAARRWRIWQAGQLIRRVQVRIVDNDHEYSVRAFRPARYVGRDEPGYLAERDIRDDPTARALLLRRMEREWRSMRRRWGDLEEFWKMVIQDQP
ncbi:MAG: hypothetical protein J2P57_04890 [Acidimicrobiaceae bacterium]|nr:hypothetical protein [Acidimicrobiaceae bacterium]